MGNGNSKENGPETPGLMGKLGGIPRAAAITEGRRAKGGQPKLPPNAIKSQAEDWAFIEVKSQLHNSASTRNLGILLHQALCFLHSLKTRPACRLNPDCFLYYLQGCLSKMLLMGKLEASVQQRVVQEMYERKVNAGEILIKEGDTGLAASELYVVKEGEFEVLERRQGVNFRVNMKNRGDCFGEISLMYSSPRSATVAATQDSTVWVLERDTFRLATDLIVKQVMLILQ